MYVFIFEIVGKKYRLGHKIGSGSFGDIYLGVDIPTGGWSFVSSIVGKYVLSTFDLIGVPYCVPYNFLL